MLSVQDQFPLHGLLDMCRSLHEAARHEAVAAAHFAGQLEACRASSELYDSYVNVLQQVKQQLPTPFILGIPLPGRDINPIQFPMLTAQLLGALQALAAPAMTPQTIQRAWDDPRDADYDAIEG